MSGNGKRRLLRLYYNGKYIHSYSSNNKHPNTSNKNFSALEPGYLKTELVIVSYFVSSGD